MKAYTFFNYFPTFIKFLIYKLATNPSSIEKVCSYRLQPNFNPQANTITFS